MHLTQSPVLFPVLGGGGYQHRDGRPAPEFTLARTCKVSDAVMKGVVPGRASGTVRWIARRKSRD